MTSTIFSRGLLALASNSGHHADDDFSWLFQIGVKAKYYATDRLYAGIGYDFLYWDNVLRAGNQINANIDPRLRPRKSKL
jgi:hypothetical protein